MANGEMSIDRQLAFLRKVWGGKTQGYVFLPWLPGHLTTKAERKARGAWQEVCFKWPEDVDKVRAHLEERTADDLYFCPNIFEQPHRTSEVLDINQRVLYADLDEVDPRQIDDDYRPTIAWQTSDDRYQAVWLLAQNEIGLSEEGNENHRLTYYLGADKNGWHDTKVLRVPGRVNHKPGKRGQQGVLLWEGGPVYAGVEDFKDLPEVRAVAHADIDDVILDSIDRRQVWRGLRMKVSTRCRDYMSIRDSEVALEAAESFPEGMSGLLWYVERELADAGATVAEIVAIVRPMPWNKFAGRHDELTRLKREASKAVALVADDALEVVDDDLDGDVSVSLDVFLAMRRARPTWLVDKIWPAGAVGFIAGSPKSYKSWVALDLAISVATGTPFLGVYRVKQGKVLYVQEEDSDTEVEDRIHKVLDGKDRHIHPWGWMEHDNGGESGLFWNPAAGERLMRLVVRKGLDLTSDSWQGYLAEQCEEHDYDLIIIDTLGTTSGDMDTDKMREVNKALKPLKTLADQYHVAVCVVHHFSHAGRRGDNGKRGGSKMLGSVALHAWVESALYVSEKTEVSTENEGGGTVSVMQVERECKSAQDLRFSLEVPKIMRGTGWTPVVSESKYTDGDSEANEGDQPVGFRSKAKWGEIVKWLKNGGATNKDRALSISDILDRFATPGTKRQTIDSRLKAGISDGVIQRRQNGSGFKYWISNSGGD